MRLFFVMCLLLVSFVATTLNAQDSGELKSLLDDSWEFGLRESPTFATDVGDHRFNDQLSHQSIADQKRRLSKEKEFLQCWTAIDRSTLSKSDRINYDIFGRILKTRIAESEFEMYLIPISNRWGFHIWFPELPSQVPLNNVKDYENYTARLQAFSRLTDENIALMRAGSKKGLTPDLL